MKKLTVMLDDKLYTATKVGAARKDQLLKDFVADALSEWLEIQEDLELKPLIEEARREAGEQGYVSADEVFDNLGAEHGKRRAI